MSVKYRRIGQDLVEVWRKSETIRISELRRDLIELREQLAMPLPTDDDLLAEARMMHPVFAERDHMEQRIAEMEIKLASLQAQPYEQKRKGL